MQPPAKIICDSISERGHRLTTMEVVMHRFVLAEFNTHRVFSRNSASSRAIPFRKIKERVLEDTAFPVKWAKEQPGMQGGDSLEDTNYSVACWENGMTDAVSWAQALHDEGVHKSLCNRLLEPFMWHTAIITATEFDNFFYQRCHKDAQPEIKATADAMQLAYYTNKPSGPFTHGMWHLPYIGSADEAQIQALSDKRLTPLELTEYLKKVSVARCARVSYLTHDGIRDMEKDIELFEKLQNSGHWSPFEHVATPSTDGMTMGNFVGWRQYRKSFLGENKRDFIPNLSELAHVQMEMEAGIKYKQGVRVK